MNGMSLFQRIIGVGATTCCIAALSPLAATAHADNYGSVYTTVTAEPNAAVSQATLSPLTATAFLQDPTLVFLGAQIWALPQEPTLVLSPSALLWGG